MARPKAVAVPVKKGRPANPAKAKADTKPIVTFLPSKLHARAKLAAIALSTNLSTVIRDLLSAWVIEQKKAIADIVNMKDEVEEDEDDVEVDEDDDEDTEEVDEDDEDEE